MFMSRARPLEAAREIVDSTYSFKKGQSKSKKYVSFAPVSKCPKIIKDFREHRMKELEDELQNLSERIDYKHKRRMTCEGLKECEITKHVKK